MKNVVPKFRAADLIFCIGGIVSGMFSTLLWNDNENFLLQFLIPGWAFGLVFILILGIKVKTFSLKFFIKALVWIGVCAACFGWAHGIASDSTRLSGIFEGSEFIYAGFITTLFMVGVFRLLFGDPSWFSLLAISIFAGVISFFGLILALRTEQIIILFVSYHTLVAWYLAATLELKDLRIDKW